MQLNINIEEEMFDKFLIPPISLQALIENAIKHNEFSDASPLVITIKLEGEDLIVHNKNNKRSGRKQSSKIGLQNLNERYKLTTDKTIQVQDDGKDFIVRLPVLRMS